MAQSTSQCTCLSGKGNTDIKTESGCSWTIEPDMTLDSTLGPDITMILGYNTSFFDWHGPSWDTSLGHWRDLRWCFKLKESTSPLMVIWAIIININHHCYIRATDQDRVLGSRLGLNITMALVDNLATHFSPFLNTLTSSDWPLFPLHKQF